ncbi:MAG: hypothetical protein QXO75_07235 [Nitrososphaerota archaeon]
MRCSGKVFSHLRYVHEPYAILLPHSGYVLEEFEDAGSLHEQSGFVDEEDRPLAFVRSLL